MIATLLRVYVKNLRRDRAVQILAFVVPIAFFSIFAFIFGGRGGGFSTGRIKVALIDDSHTPRSAALVAALVADSGLSVATHWSASKQAAPESMTVALAESLVRAGEVNVGLVLPSGIDTSLARFDGRGVKVRILSDPADPVAAKMTGGLLQRATLTAIRSEAAPFLGAAAPSDSKGVDDLMPARFEEEHVLGDRPTSPMVAYYAAGIAVMFIMFSAAGAAGGLIEETEAGTLERVLTSGSGGMSGLLAAKWLYVTILAVVQITLMFVWGAIAFRLPLLPHLPGFAIVTVFSAAAAAAFGLVLGTAARTRQQLQGMANLVVLTLSAIGGSMIPSQFLPEIVQKISQIGFNAWSLDAYRKVFWREASLPDLAPDIGALIGFTLLFLFIARRLARRWEAA